MAAQTVDNVNGATFKSRRLNYSEGEGVASDNTPLSVLEGTRVEGLARTGIVEGTRQGVTPAVLRSPGTAPQIPIAES